MNIDPNAPARPAQTDKFWHLGLTKREELIFRIAAGYAASGTPSDEHIAALAVSLADAVLAEMNKEKV